MTGLTVEPALVDTRQLADVPLADPPSMSQLLAYIAPDVTDDAPQRFERLAPRMTDAQYWTLLAGLWVYTDTPHRVLRVWRRLFRSERPGRDHAMSGLERDELAALPDHVEVFRGFCNHGAENGIAWTPDFDLAVAFAERWVGYAGPADGLYVAQVRIPRDRIVALFDRESIDGREVIVPSLRGFRRRVDSVRAR